MKPISLAQATRSVAAMVISSQALFAWKEWNGKLRRPVALAWADAVLDAGVLAVAQFQPGKLTRDHPVGGVGEKPGDAMPIAIVKDKAPGCGRSLHTISLVPAGHFDRSTKSMAW